MRCAPGSRSSASGSRRGLIARAPKVGSTPVRPFFSTFSFQAASLQHFVLSSLQLSKFPTLLTLIEHAGQNAGSAPGGAVAGNARRARAWCGWLRWRGLVRFGVYKAGGCWARLRPNGRATALEGTGSGRRAAGQAAWAAFAGPLPSGRGQAWASPALATSAAAIVRFPPFSYLPRLLGRANGTRVTRFSPMVDFSGGFSFSSLGFDPRP